MMYNKTAELRELYFQHSPYTAKEAKPDYPPLLQWPSHGYFERLKPDSALLKEALQSYITLGTSTVAEQVFGNQARQQKLGLKHLANILYERALLHSKHLKEIGRCLMGCQEKISILKMHFPVDGGKSQQNLERVVLQLEQERRTEEINFWKDTTEIREKLFEDAAEYSATKRRQDMLYGVERENA